MGFLTLVLFLSLGCRTVRRSEPLTGKVDTSDPGVARGEVVFNRYCHQCHPGGEGGLGPALNDKPAPVFLMKTQVRVGLGTMPAFHQQEISARDLDDLMSYIIKLRKSEGK